MAARKLRLFAVVIAFGALAVALGSPTQSRLPKPPTKPKPGG